MDLLVWANGTSLREFVEWRAEHDLRAIDVFMTTDGKAADSPITGSHLERDDLVFALDALLLWERASGFVQTFDEWEQEISDDVDFVLTMVRQPPAVFNRVRGAIASEGLPDTFLGGDWWEVGQRIIDIIGRSLRVGARFNKKAERLTKEAITPANEYDFQNLIATVLRPWIPTLERETVTVKFADQKKLVDFGAMDNQLLIEAKRVSGSGSAAEVLKTLDGLADFYKSHPNVRILLFLILVLGDMPFDDAKVESKYTQRGIPPEVITRVFHLP